MQKKNQINKMKSEQYLSGPNIWKEYQFTDDQGNNKWFHMFGDKHIVIPKEFCPNGYNFIDFLEDWFNELSKYKIYSEFYLEIPYKLNEKNIEEDSYLTIIYKKFRDCFINSNKCKYMPYVKMHTTDIRSTHKFVGHQFNQEITTTVPQLIKNRILYLLQSLSNLTEKRKVQLIKTASFIQLLVDRYLPIHSMIFKLLLTSDDYEVEIKKILEPIYLEFDSDIYHESDFDKLKETNQRLFSLKDKNKKFILKHQLDQLQKDNVKHNDVLLSDLILQFMIQTSNYYQKEQLSKFYNAWSNIFMELIGDLDIRKIVGLIDLYQKDLNVPLTVIDSTLLDCYILAKSFRNQNNDLKRTVLTVIFEGSNHVDIQSIFFEQVLKIKPLHSVKGMKQHTRCLDIGDISKVFDAKQYAENVLLVRLI
jgi:hypothetical protein